MNPLPALSQRLSPCTYLGRHRHVCSYAAVVLAGAYVEAGEIGRRRLVAGDVALHADFAAHANRVEGAGAWILNLPINGIDDAFASVADPDAVARLAARSADEASALLCATLRPLPLRCADWPDRLALDLAADPSLSLTQWAQRHGLAPATLSRGFQRAFGVTPRRMRFEWRARCALQAASHGVQPLAHVALEAGFADQAQMSRAVSELTGRPPGYWRRWGSSGDKTRSQEAGTVR